MKQQIITWVSPLELKEGKAASELYSLPDNYELIKENISQVGILTPLHVNGDVVVSGNLRLRIARELNLDLVPVLYVEPSPKLSCKLLAVSYAQQREKKYSEILAEAEILEAEYPVGKGKRTDKNPELKSNMEKRKSLNISKSKLNKLKAIKRLAKELYGEESNDYTKVWSELDSGKSNPSAVHKQLEREKAVRDNEQTIPSHYNILTEHAKVYNKFCSGMREIEDKSVACIVTSPPYYQMKDYGTGKNQRGMEKDIESYLDNLINDFGDCMRVLKDEGSLWVVISEPIVNGEHHQICQRFAMKMRKKSWRLNDEIIWVKKNSQFIEAKRTVRAHEYVFHFVKSNDYYYNDSWLSGLLDPNNAISIGTSSKVAKLISAMDFRGSVIKTNNNNMNDLRKQCRDEGFCLTHNAAFPITIPLIAILTTSKVDDIVLDIYSGTGTTGEAALACNRRYIGYEIKSEFVKSSEVRLKEYISITDSKQQNEAA